MGDKNISLLNERSTLLSTSFYKHCAANAATSPASSVTSRQRPLDHFALYLWIFFVRQNHWPFHRGAKIRRLNFTFTNPHNAGLVSLAAHHIRECVSAGFYIREVRRALAIRHDRHHVRLVGGAEKKRLNCLLSLLIEAGTQLWREIVRQPTARHITVLQLICGLRKCLLKFEHGIRPRQILFFDIATVEGLAIIVFE